MSNALFNPDKTYVDENGVEYDKGECNGPGIILWNATWTYDANGPLVIGHDPGYDPGVTSGKAVIFPGVMTFYDSDGNPVDDPIDDDKI